MNLKQQKIFDAILAAVAERGWTEDALRHAAKKCALSPAEMKRFFPRGVFDAVEAFHLSIDAAMQARIAAGRKFAALRVRDKIIFAVRARLEAIEDNREAMRRLLVWGMLPRHLRMSTQYLWRAADAVWTAAGDTSTDYNYYTKRLLLIAVMKTTLSFWLNDRSAGHRETWAFLDRRIADVMTLGKGINVAKTVGISDIVSFVRARMAA